MKVGGHHADHPAVHVVDSQTAPDDARVGGEVALPQTITDDDDSVVARFILFIKKTTTEKRFDAQDREEARRDAMAEDPQRLNGAGQDELPSPIDRHIGEDPILLLQVDKVGSRKRKPQRPLLRLCSPQLHNLIRTLVRERSEQHSVYHAEYGRVGSDT